MQEGNRICIVSHAEDLDGLASAALLARKFGVCNESIYFADYSYQLLSFVFEMLRNGNCKAVFVTDLSVNESRVNAWLKVLSSLRRKGAKIFWIDHHPWPENAKAVANLCDMAEYGENKKYCTTEIIAKLFKLKDPYASRLERIVHASDFALKPASMAESKIQRSYDLAIAYANTLPIAKQQKLLRNMARLISEGKLENKRISMLAQRFERQSEKEVAKALEKNYEIEGIAVAFSGNKVLQDDLLAKLFDKSHKDIVMLVNLDKRKASIRSKTKDISKLAALLGGGGHPHAAGFPIKNAYDLKTEKGRQSFLKLLAKKAKMLN